jgi:hypothetical protein
MHHWPIGPWPPLSTQAQDGASPDTALVSAAQLGRRLRDLVVRLDSLLPYLSLAISAALLLNQGAVVGEGRERADARY